MQRIIHSKLYSSLVIAISISVVFFSAQFFWSAVLAPFVDGAENVGTIGWYLFAFVAGLTMVIMPCTLPMAFLVHPTTNEKGIFRGIALLLAFGAGTVVMFSAYGLAAAFLGETVMDITGIRGEQITNWIYLFTGVFIYVLALGDAGLLSARVIPYSGTVPKFIRGKGAVIKAFLLGVFLGNIGIMSPHTAIPLLLIKAASSGDIFFGWSLFLVNALGRIVSLLFLVLVGAFGVRALDLLLERKAYFKRWSASMMIVVSGFIITLGLFTREWWVNSGGEEALVTILGGMAEGGIMSNGAGLFGQPLIWGDWFLIFLWTIPLWWYYLNEEKRVLSTPALQLRRLEEQARDIEEERRGLEVLLRIGVGKEGKRIKELEKQMDSLQKERVVLEEGMRYGAASGLRDDASQMYEERILRLRFWLTLSATLLLVVIFVYLLPTLFD